MRLTQITANLKCSRFAVLFSVLKHSLSQPNSRIYTNHTISQREVGESSTMATKLLGTTSNELNRAWNSSPPRRGLRGINSQSQQNQPLSDSQNPELPDSTTRNLRVFKPTSRQCHVCQIRNFRISNPELPDFKSGTSGFALAAMLKCVREAFVSLSTHMGYLSTETKPKTIVMHPS